MQPCNRSSICSTHVKGWTPACSKATSHRTRPPTLLALWQHSCRKDHDLRSETCRRCEQEGTTARMRIHLSAQRASVVNKKGLQSGRDPTCGIEAAAAPTWMASKGPYSFSTLPSTLPGIILTVPVFMSSGTAWLRLAMDRSASSLCFSTPSTCPAWPTMIPKHPVKYPDPGQNTSNYCGNWQLLCMACLLRFSRA